MSSSSPRVLVGCPTSDLKADSLERYIQGLDSLTYGCFDIVIEDNSATPEYSEKIKRHAQEWEEKNPGRAFRVIHSGQISPKARARLVYGRNRIREIVLKENYDYFLSLEQDVVPPENAIQSLMSKEKDIISGTYLNRKRESDGAHLQVMAGIYGNEEEKKNNIVRSMGLLNIFPSRVFEVAYTGLGCALIQKKVLEKISFRYDDANLACDDVYFCMDAKKNGFQTFLDSNVLCAHYFNDAFRKTEY